MSKVIDLHKEIECHGEILDSFVQEQLKSQLVVKEQRPEPEIYAQDAIEEWE